VAKFVFRLAVLKRFRENRLLMARKDLMIVENKIFELTTSLKKALADRGDLLDSSARALGTSAAFLDASLLESETVRISRLQRAITAQEIERERHARWVTHLGRELKAIEKLEEKKREAFEQIERDREKRSMDNWVAERWTFSQNNSLLHAPEEEVIS